MSVEVVVAVTALKALAAALEKLGPDRSRRVLDSLERLRSAEDLEDLEDLSLDRPQLAESELRTLTVPAGDSSVEMTFAVREDESSGDAELRLLGVVEGLRDPVPTAIAERQLELLQDLKEKGLVTDDEVLFDVQRRILDSHLTDQVDER